MRAVSEFSTTVVLPVTALEQAKAINVARAETNRAIGYAEACGSPTAALLLRCAGKLLDARARAYSRRLESKPTRDPNMKFALACLALLLVPVVALAQASLPVELPVDVALSEFLKSLGGLPGAGALGIAVIVSQAAMRFFQTPLANFAGKWKLLIATGIAILTAFLGLLANGVDWKGALLHSVTIGAVNTFLHQLVKQLTEKPADPAA
jgi:low affinity Fe/Cu permease